MALAIGILMVFVGLSIDYGRAYVAKTTLAKAVDAAALKGMKNVNLGTGYSAQLQHDQRSRSGCAGGVQRQL